MHVNAQSQSIGQRVLIVIRAVIVGLLVGMIAANIWPLLLLSLGMPVAAGAEIVFLALYLWWVSGGGPPNSLLAARAQHLRLPLLSGAQSSWGIVAAVSCPATLPAALVLLLRMLPCPAAAVHQGHDVSVIPW